MRCLTLSLSLLIVCIGAPAAQARTMDLDAGGMSGVATDGLGAASKEERTAILRGQKLAEAVTAMANELEARGDYQTILAVADDLIDMAPDNIRLRHLKALALAADGNGTAAAEVLDEFPESTDDGIWGLLARVMILRNEGELETAERHAAEALDRAQDNAYAHNLAGTISFAQDALDRAGRHFARAAELQPESDTYLANLGAVERLRGNTTAAADALQAALQINPTACGALINHAGLLQDTGDLAGAQTELETCLEAEPGNRHAITQVIEVLTERRHYDPALDLATRHADILPEPGTTRARLALLLGDPAQAEAVLAEAGPGPATDLLMAHAAAGRGDQDRARDLARGLINRLPERPDLVPGVIGFLATGGMIDPALMTDRQENAMLVYLQGLGAAVAGNEAAMREELITDAIDIPGLNLTGFPEAQIARIAGSPATPWLTAALTHDLEGYHQLADTAALQAIEAAPDLALAHVIRARSAASLGDGDGMLEALERALDLAPEGAAPNLLRGEAAMSIGDLPRAIEHFERVLEVTDSAGAALRLGLVADRLGEDERAERAYERLIQITPRSYIGYNQLAWFLASREHDLDRALDLARQANEMMPENASIQDTIGWILHLQGDTETGVVYLRRAFEIAGWEMPSIGLRLARAELTLGHRAEARDLLQVLAERPQDDENGQQARKILESL